MANIYDYLDYRPFIQKSANERHFTKKSLAQETRIHPSYFSRVMVEKASFSISQLYQIARALKLSERETEFLLLLGAWDSAATPEEKAFHKSRAQQFQSRENQVIRQMESVDNLEQRQKDAELYYREAVTARIHMHLTIERYRLNPEGLCRKLHLTQQKLDRELEKLETLGLIRRHRGAITVLKEEVHLDESSALSTSNHINWRLATVESLLRRDGSPTDYHVSAVFSADEETKFQLKQLFKQFLLNAQKIVGKSAKTSEVYHLTFDLFE